MSETPRYDVSVILPFGDDEEAVGIAVKRTAEHLRSLGVSFEILAIDEDSGDNSHAVLALLRAEVTPPAGLLPALGISHAAWIGGNKMDYFVELDSAAELRALRPDHGKLRASTKEVRGVIVTARSDSGDFDFISRFFAPGSGIDEDPVTGSAHCALAPYWAAKLDKTTMTGYQASPRGGVVEVELRGDRVLLRGTAVTVVAGELRA